MEESKGSIQILNVPDWLRKEAKIKAAKEGRPLSEILREMIDQWVSGELKPKQED